MSSVRAIAADYRLRGLYDLALATARADPSARVEEARALTRLGWPERALEVLELAAAAPADTPPAAETADTALARAEALLALGRGAEAETVLASLPTDAVDVPAGLALDLSANALILRGEAARALAPAARAAAVLGILGAPAEHAQALATVATAHHHAAQWSAAAEAWQEARAALASLPDHPDHGVLLDGAGNTARRRGALSEAVAAHRAAAAFHARLDRHHPARAANHHALAQALHRGGDFAGAREQMAEALTISLRRPGPDHVDTWVTRFELGRFEVDCGAVEEGFGRMEEARRVVAIRLGADHPMVKAMARWL